MPCAIPEHLVAAYRTEAGELLAELESSLLDLTRTPTDADLVHRAFRALHALRGSAAMFGLDDLAAFAPEVEAVLEAVRDGWIRVTPDLLTLVLQAKDLLRTLLAGATGPDDPVRARLVDALRARLPAAEAVLPAGPPLPPPTPPPEGRKTFRLRFRPHPELFRNGTDVLALLGELRELGRYEAVARSRALPRLEELAPETCYLGCDVILTTDRGLDAVLDAFSFVYDRCDLKVEVVDDENAGEGAETRLGQILIDRGEISPDAVDRALAGRQRIGELLSAQGLVSAEAVQAAMVEQRFVREERQRREGGSPAVAAGFHASVSSLDQVCDLVSELVIAQAHLVRLASRSGDPELIRVSEDVERLLAELRSRTLDVRKVAPRAGA